MALLSTPAPAGSTNASSEDTFTAALAASKAGHRDWQQTPTERGQVNGLLNP